MLIEKKKRLPFFRVYITLRTNFNLQGHSLEFELVLFFFVLFFLLSEVPRSDGAGDDHVLTGDDELSDPEDAEDVEPSHSEDPLALLVGHVTGLGTQHRIADRLDDNKAGQPTSQSHDQRHEGLRKKKKNSRELIREI